MTTMIHETLKIVSFFNQVILKRIHFDPAIPIRTLLYRHCLDRISMVEFGENWTGSTSLNSAKLCAIVPPIQDDHFSASNNPNGSVISMESL